MNDNFINFDNDDIIKRILRQHGRPLKKIINNTELKDVGDRVVVLDYSSVSHLNGEQLDDTDYDKIDMDENAYYIVIETRKKVVFKDYVQDIVIVNPRTNEQFRVASRHLRIYRRFWNNFNLNSYK